jgi:hypothetical protein
METIEQIADDVVPSNGVEQKQDFPSLEQLDKMRNDLLTANAKKCADEIGAILEKYKMRLTWQTIIDDGKLVKNDMLIISR